MVRLHDMVFSLMINTTGCGAKSSSSGGAVIPVRGHACRRRPGPGGPLCCGVAEGAALGSGVGGGGGGAGFEVQPPLPLCQAEYASVTTGRMPGAADQDLRRSEVWLGNRHRLAGVMAGLWWPAHHRRPVVPVVARGSMSLCHSVALGGAWYTNRLEWWMNLAHIGGGGVPVWRVLCVVDVGGRGVCGIVCGESMVVFYHHRVENDNSYNLCNLSSSNS
jgi:hypothetical protein